MSIISALKNMLQGRNFSSLEPDQEMALVDALTYAMAVDHEVAPAEEEELSDALRVLSWSADQSLDAYVHTSVTRAQASVKEQRTAEYCRDISERLGEDWLREETYYLAARVAASDNEIVSEEQVLLSTMVDAFDLDDATHERITNQLLREVEF